MILETERLTLRPITLHDRDSIYEYRSDRETNKYQGWIPSSKKDVEHFIRKIAGQTNLPDSWFQFAIIEKKTEILIGDLGIHFLEEGSEQAEIGCTLNKTFQKAGYATEALQKVLDYLFLELKKHRVFASIDPDNLPSIGLVERLGFRKEAHFVESLLINGKWVDDLVFAIIEKEWKTVNKPDNATIRSNDINHLLAARELRMHQKTKMIRDGYHLVSLQLNIPGLPKSNNLIKAFFNHVDERFQEYFISRYNVHQWDKADTYTDPAGDWAAYLFDKSVINATRLKEITEGFEQSFALGRTVDLDVLDNNGTPISSGKAKACFVCGQPAEQCRKNQKHDIHTVREKMSEAIKSYLDKLNGDKLIQKISGFITYALLQEVSLSPKPGLVCRNHNGSHNDMDFSTFLQSTAAISPHFDEIGKLAVNFEGIDTSTALPKIREIGLRMERSMLESTNNVNTHKGAIFLMATSMFALVRAIKESGTFNVNRFAIVLQQLTKGIVENELARAKKHMSLTHGQKCFLEFGKIAGGARDEVEQGMPTVVKHALPFLNKLSNTKLNSYSDKQLKQLLIPVLLKIMSVNNDTNVLYRKGKAALNELKIKSTQTLEDWSKGNKTTYEQLVEWCLQQGISPGGSADLLAVTLLLHQCEKEYCYD